MNKGLPDPSVPAKWGPRIVAHSATEYKNKVAALGPRGDWSRESFDTKRRHYYAEEHVETPLHFRLPRKWGDVHWIQLPGQYSAREAVVDGNAVIRDRDFIRANGFPIL